MWFSSSNEGTRPPAESAAPPFLRLGLRQKAIENPLEVIAHRVPPELEVFFLPSQQITVLVAGYTTGSRGVPAELEIVYFKPQRVYVSAFSRTSENEPGDTFCQSESANPRLVSPCSAGDCCTRVSRSDYVCH